MGKLLRDGIGDAEVIGLRARNAADQFAVADSPHEAAQALAGQPPPVGT